MTLKWPSSTLQPNYKQDNFHFVFWVCRQIFCFSIACALNTKWSTRSWCEETVLKIQSFFNKMTAKNANQNKTANRNLISYLRLRLPIFTHNYNCIYIIITKLLVWKQPTLLQDIRIRYFHISAIYNTQKTSFSLFSTCQ